MPVPDMRGHFDGRLYCAVPASDVPRILAEGTGDRVTYWGVADVVAYYAETIEDEGEEAATLVVRLEDLDAGALEPDHPGIEEPITTVIGCSEADVHSAWAGSPGGWRDSLDIVGSLRHRGPISPGLIAVDE